MKTNSKLAENMESNDAMFPVCALCDVFGVYFGNTSGWSIDWLIDCAIDWLFLIGRSSDWSIDWLID